MSGLAEACGAPVPVIAIVAEGPALVEVLGSVDRSPIVSLASFVGRYGRPE